MRKRARPASVAEGGAEFMTEPAAPEIFVLLLEQIAHPMRFLYQVSFPARKTGARALNDSGIS
jgi:hypothetical protein